MKAPIFFFLMLFAINTNAQLDDLDLTPADSLVQEGKIKDAILEFESAYNKGNRDSNYLYNYACALAEDNQIDKSFNILKQSLDNQLRLNPLFDSDLLNLREDKRWNSFENDLINKFENKNNIKIKDKEYAKQLWEMKALDQAYYFQIYLAERKIGKNTNVVNTLWKLKEGINKENLKNLELLIKKKGFPKKSSVGGEASTAAFLIIQHSDLKTQKKYIKTIEELCKINEADSQSYAYMYDRIQVSESKPQRYGTQLKFNKITNEYELLPLENKEKVDIWRSEMRLEKLNDYLKGFGVKL